MGVSEGTLTIAARHAHALVVEVPGWGRTRMVIERAVLARGWQLAQSPADADVLIVCGTPGLRLIELVEVMWHQMPGPRVRVQARGHDDVVGALDEAHALLLDPARHRQDALKRPGADGLLARQPHHSMAGHDPGGHHHHGEPDDAGDHGDGHGAHQGHSDQGGHEGHEGMDMSPGGIPLAEGGEDRDGLEMDVLKIRLGPVLPHWPAGLVLDCSLQGDLITEARAEVLSAGDASGDEAGARARQLDNLVSVLALAGWEDAAAQARKVRDAALGTEHGPADGNGLERLRRRVRRSWTLRWSLRGLRPLTEEEVRHHGLPVDAVGDTYDRVIRMVDRAAEATRHSDRPALRADHLAQLLVGLDLAAARLVLASLDLRELQADHAEHGVADG